MTPSTTVLLTNISSSPLCLPLASSSSRTGKLNLKESLLLIFDNVNAIFRCECSSEEIIFLLLYFRGFLLFNFGLKYRWKKEKKRKENILQNKKKRQKYFWVYIIHVDSNSMQTSSAHIMHPRNGMALIFCWVFLFKIMCFFHQGYLLLAGEHFIPTKDFIGVWSFFLESVDTLKCGFCSVRIIPVEPSRLYWF